MPSSTEKAEDIPLCCCKVDGTTFEFEMDCTYCQALDSIDGKVTYCTGIRRENVHQKVVARFFIAVFASIR